MECRSSFNPLPPTWTGDAAQFPAFRRYCDWFQSAPAHMDGRCSRASSGSPWTTSFNPLPPTWTGDAADTFVLTPFLKMFQSAPAHMDGRCLRSPRTVVQSARGFQSAPAHMDGRCVVPVRSDHALSPFQSAPAHMDGRCGDSAPTVTLVNSVSIRSRPHGREMRYDYRVQPNTVVFQSAPAHMDGRCWLGARSCFASPCAHPGANHAAIVRKHCCGTATQI